MNKRELGNTGVSVSPLMFGGNVFGWTIDEAASFKILDAMADTGLDFIDTADIYSNWVPGNKGGDSEMIIGNWLKRSGRRSEIILATKVGMEMAPDKKGLSKGYIIKAAEDSLKRLQTDYIDLYQSHTDDDNTPLEETFEAYASLIQDGKVRLIGASNYTAERLEKALQVSSAHNLPAYQTLQPDYNLYERENYETNLEPVCMAHKLGVISYFSLASGFLTGKYRAEKDLSKSQRGERVKKYMNDRGFRILEALDRVADQYQASHASIALAWIISRPSITAPIASASSTEQLKELVKATELKLSTESLELLTRASAW